MFFIHFAPRLWSVKVNNICQLSYLRCMRHALILFLSGRLTRRLYTTAICKSVALYSISNTPCSWRDCSGVSKVTLYFCRSVTHFVFRGLQRNVGAHILLQVLFIYDSDIWLWSNLHVLAWVCKAYLLDQCMNYDCPVATTWQPLEPLWLDVVTTDAVCETPALPSSGMCWP